MKMVNALNKLKEAYYEVLNEWENTDLNETESIKKYPFEKSFDELGLVEWIEATIEELEGGVKMKYIEEFEEYLAELFDYNEDLILEYLDDEELYEEFLEQKEQR